MFSVLSARLFSRLGASTAPLAATRQIAAPASISRAIFASGTRRTFVSSTRLSLAAAAAATKPATTKKPAAKKASTATTKAKATKATAAKAKATPKKKTAVKKAAPKKKKPAPKKKVVKKKPVVKKKEVKPERVTKAMGPPPRLMSGFMLFNKEQSALPGVTVVERARKNGAAWRELSESEQESYRERAAIVREEMRVAYDKWMTEVDPALLRRLNKQRVKKNFPRIKNHQQPKRPMSSYMLFFKDQHALHGALVGREAVINFAKQVGQDWRSLPEDKKEEYLEKGRKAMAEFKSEHPKA
ncbi:hypothetical protein FB45DRAFT_928680 [Roridomyces roridus]|uniref:HMG box domain-containing protein n=1 Tax=Roridomyces roridus TaxID=1738132 RepID=A0AAD7BHQ7_9AGAR|nr:hypothetical protein FB45DRAFT_928680 [Roridomyces roridus]